MEMWLLHHDQCHVECLNKRKSTLKSIIGASFIINKSKNIKIELFNYEIKVSLNKKSLLHEVIIIANLITVQLNIFVD